MHNLSCHHNLLNLLQDNMTYLFLMNCLCLIWLLNFFEANNKTDDRIRKRLVEHKYTYIRIDTKAITLIIVCINSLKNMYKLMGKLIKLVILAFFPLHFYYLNSSWYSICLVFLI